MSELGDKGRSYRETAETLWQLREQQAQGGPEETYKSAILEAEVILSILENKGVAEDFIGLIDAGDEEDPEVAERRSVIEGLRETSLYTQGIITDEDIDGQLAALPESKESEDMRFAKGYVVAKALWSSLTYLPYSGLKQEQTQADEGDTNPTGDENGEEEPEDAVKIVFYRGDNVLAVGDKVVPLTRSTDVAQQTGDEESALERFKLEVIKRLGANPGQENEKQVRELWEDIFGTEVAAGKLSGWWNNYVADFIEGLEVNGEKLFTLRKPTPQAKRRYYYANKPIQVEETDDAHGGLQLVNFKLENGAVIGGKAGKLSHLLLRASEEEPVTHETLLQYGVYDEAYLASLQSPETALSGLVSSLRSDLREKQERHYVIRRTLVGEELGHGRRQSGYWMERYEADTLDEIFRAKKAIALLTSRQKELKEAGVQPIDHSITAKFKDFGDEVDIEKDLDEAKQILSEWVRRVHDGGDDVYEMDQTDPRWQLVEYLFDKVITSPESEKLFRTVMGIATNGNRQPKGETPLQKLARQAGVFFEEQIEVLGREGKLSSREAKIHINGLEKIFGTFVASKIEDYLANGRSRVNGGGNVSLDDALEILITADPKFADVMKGGKATRNERKRIIAVARETLNKHFESKEVY